MLGRVLRLLGAYRLYEKWLRDQVKRGKIPEHVAVVLDGNRRWASEKSLPSLEGHRQGVKIGEQFLDWCLSLGINTVTIYVFSTENFQRPKDQVKSILQLVEDQIRMFKQDSRLRENRVRFKALGKLDLLPESLQEELREIEKETEKYNQHYLNIAIAYGGRTEIIDAAKTIAEEVRRKKLEVDEISETLFGKYLYTAHLPNPYPDLIIRTSGEERLSGFLLWQSAYSELSFLDVYWPDFRKIDLLRSIRTYQRRMRRFGR